MAISSKHGVKRPKVVEEPESSDSEDDQPEDDFEVEIKREEDDCLDSSNLEGDSFMAYPDDEDSVEIKEEDLDEVDIKEEVVEAWEAEGSAEETKTKETERKGTKKVKFSEPEPESDNSDFSESDNEEDNFADDDSEKEEGEVKKSVGSGLANVMAKILGTKKSEDVILSKAKTDKAVKKTRKLDKEDTFEIVDGSGQVKKEPTVEIKEEEEDRKPDISLHDREIHRKLWEEKFRKRPSITEDKEKERRLRVLATHSHHIMPPESKQQGSGCRTDSGRGQPSQPATHTSAASDIMTEELEEGSQASQKNEEPDVPPTASESDDDVASHSQGLNQKSRRVKIKASLTPEQEQVMVEWLEAHPILYNKNLISYKDRERKEMLWLEKAAELGRPVPVLKTWYTSLRIRYVTLRKKSRDPDPKLTEREEWILKVFEFLRPHVCDVQRMTTLNGTIAATAAPEDQKEDMPGPRPAGSATQAVPSPSLLRSSLAAPRSMAQRQGVQKKSIQQCGDQQVVQPLKSTGNKEREAYADWIRTVILNLDRSLWRRFQHQISNLMYEFMAENNKVKTLQVAAATTSQDCQPSQPTSLGMQQPLPSQRPAKPTGQMSVCHSQDPQWVAQQLLTQQQFPPLQQQPPQQRLTNTQMQTPTPSSGPGSSSSRSCEGMQASTPVPLLIVMNKSQDSSHL
ncbi:uncharacterized protein LOC126980913 isoform X2 [Eriocheir sinensis]|nr:uncharacterized protein LOC126980913 isoform X2 [Eriocheir sinensis]XP_050687356.1 uncharacterized protein LOC126980913 isoform X2 [Eriocheir sinensis]XP_050687360.1 uncharacterized protein LOC126980913 isoform X2 [Eriocheir sinensis]XP_050687366.1 uncharacterized protein LOC126980913 isoform X2 [Eriocheir sinensis]